MRRADGCGIMELYNSVDGHDMTEIKFVVPKATSSAFQK